MFFPSVHGLGPTPKPGKGGAFDGGVAEGAATSVGNKSRITRILENHGSSVSYRHLFCTIVRDFEQALSASIIMFSRPPYLFLIWQECTIIYLQNNIYVEQMMVLSLIYTFAVSAAVLTAK